VEGVGMRTVNVLETFHPDPESIAAICDVWIPRARKKHTELIGLSTQYAQGFDEPELEGMAVERARIRLAVNRAACAIRLARRSEA